MGGEAGKQFKGGRKVDLDRYGSNHDGINWNSKREKKNRKPKSNKRKA